jgi:ADP-heptose:LPS heptosyltransferase
MKFQKIQFPARTLIVSSLAARYAPFTLYFLKLWKDRFSIQPDFSGTSELARDFASPVAVPAKFRACLYFLWKKKYRTVVFLNPEPKADRNLKRAARLLFIGHRAGFAPLKGLSTLNYSLPFNTENHHYVHQLKIFFEYLIGEKIHDWKKPLLAESTTGGVPIPDESYGVIAIDTDDPASPHVAEALVRFMNASARHTRLVLLMTGAEAQKTARALSQVMTERTVEVSELVVNPTEAQKLFALRHAAWVTGTDAHALNLAALVEVPSLGLFGPLNERVWQPFSTRARMLAGDFACRPCVGYPGTVTCRNSQEWLCMSGVTGELMAATLNGMLSKRRIMET